MPSCLMGLWQNYNSSDNSERKQCGSAGSAELNVSFYDKTSQALSRDSTAHSLRKFDREHFPRAFQKTRVPWHTLWEELSRGKGLGCGELALTTLCSCELWALSIVLSL
jgi:hypothetical protein